MATQESDYFNHSLLKEDVIESREYQTVLANVSLSESTIVALPTGTGKTIVALMAGVRRLSEYGGRILFLAPTKPLVEQQAEFYREVMDIPDHEIGVFTGDIKPEDREEEWNSAKSVIAATPQVIQNDLISGRISMEDVCHITFDECHRATGEYAYGYIAEKYWKEAKNPLVLGLSASPGTDRDSILEVATNLGVTNIEALSDDDDLLKKHTFETTVDTVKVSLDDELEEVRELLYDIYTDNLEYCKDELGVLDSKRKNITINELQAGMNKARKMEEWRGVSVIAESIKLNKCIEAIETQGVDSLTEKLNRYQEEAKEDDSSKAVQRLVSKPKFKEAQRKAEEYDSQHPKTTALIAAMKDTILEGGQAIIFTQSRSNVLSLVDKLNDLGPIDAHRFVGQNNDDGAGMSQSDQKEIIEEFREGTYNVLVATSVAEEGLDIPQVGLVVFYEPVPSGVRDIQRRGRTGRAGEGTVKVLIAKGTRDEGYWYAAKQKEDEMKSELKTLAAMSDELSEELSSNQQTLEEYQKLESDEDKGEESTDSGEFSAPEETEDEEEEDADNDIQKPDVDNEDGVYIEADTREGQSSVIQSLDLSDDVEVGMSTLEVGDYILSDRVAVERKSAEDFADTLVGGDRSIFDQLGDMANHYERPILLLEGTQEELYSARDIHPNAIRGTLQSLAVDYGISVLWSRSENETANYLANIAEREQVERDRSVSVHGSKKTATEADEQEYIVSSIADIGPVTAENLLTELGTVREVMTADKETLTEVDGVGDVTAERIRSIVTKEYSPDS